MTETRALAALWRERQAAVDACNANEEGEADDDPAYWRMRALDEQIKAARPTDPAGLAVQLKLVIDTMEAEGSTSRDLVARVAQQLEALADPPA